MPGPIRLEVFEPRREGGEAAMFDSDAMEEVRLAAFEQGYKAGWDDAAAAQDEDQRRLRTDVARHLQDLSFTYHEARAHLLRGLAPLLEQICTRVVPQVAAQAIGAIVREILEPIAQAAADRPVTIVLNPASRPAVEAALADAKAPPLELVEEPSLGAGQLYLRYDDQEQHIDLDEAVTAIRAAVEAFFHTAEEMTDDG